MSKLAKNRLRKIYNDSKLKHPYKKWSLARRFWLFQKERIPLVVMTLVALSLTVAVANVSGSFDWSRIVIASLMVVLYFLQIRLADEPKDYEHDNEFYPNRPVQRGVITLRELSTIKNFSIASFLLLAVLTGSWIVILLAVLQQAYSYLTRHEFFIRDWLRKHFLTYQFIHYVQLFVLAWLTLAVLDVQPVYELFVYFVYAMLLIGLIESSRTIGGVDKKEAADRYSYRLGMHVALSFFCMFVVAVIGYTAYLVLRLESSLVWPVLLVGLLVVGWVIVRYARNPITKNADLLNGASLVLYLCSTLTLLLSV